MTKKEKEKLALEAIDKYNLLFINEIHVYLPFCRSTFYNAGLDKLDTIKKALEENRIKTKQALRTKWYASKSATLQIALYKLIANDDELRRLTNVNVEGTLNNVPFTEMDADDLKKTLGDIYVKEK